MVDMNRIKEMKHSNADRMPEDEENLRKVKQEVPELQGMNEEAFLSALDKEEGEDTPELQEISILDKKTDGSYRDDDRFICIKFMEAFQRYHGGAMKPNYTKVSRLWGVTDVTLRRWWEKREQIKRNHVRMIDSMDDMVKARVTAEYLRLLDAAAKRSYDEMSNTDFIRMLRELTAVYRLSTGQSTRNVSVNQNIRIHSAAPDTAQQGHLPEGSERQQ